MLVFLLLPVLRTAVLIFYRHELSPAQPSSQHYRLNVSAPSEPLRMPIEKKKKKTKSEGLELKAYLNQLCGLLSEYFHRSIIQAVYLFMPTTQRTSWTNMPGQVLCAKDYRRRGKRWCQIGRSKLLRRQSHRRLSLQYKGGRSNAVRQEQEVVQASTRSTSFSSQGCY